MIFTGPNLVRLRSAVDLALAEIHNQIAACPDVNKYASDIDALEQEQAELVRLSKRMDRAIEKEGCRHGALV